MMCAMLKIKPLLDEMYSEMRELYEEKERWKREASELRGELERIRREVIDESYGAEALSAPRSEVGSARISVSSQEPAVSPQEPAVTSQGSASVLPVKEEIETEETVFNFGKDTVKNVVISGNERKCEDRKEYYRMYRLKQKELKASKK